MNSRDRKFARILNPHTLLCDFRSAQASIQDVYYMVMGIAERHFGSKVQLHSYHVAAVKKGIWVVSKKEMSEDETRPIATAYHKAHK